MFHLILNKVFLHPYGTPTTQAQVVLFEQRYYLRQQQPAEKYDTAWHIVYTKLENVPDINMKLRFMHEY